MDTDPPIISRRNTLKTLGIAAGAVALNSLFSKEIPAQAASSETIQFQPYPPDLKMIMLQHADSPKEETPNPDKLTVDYLIKKFCVRYADLDRPLLNTPIDKGLDFSSWPGILKAQRISDVFERTPAIIGQLGLAVADVFYNPKDTDPDYPLDLQAKILWSKYKTASPEEKTTILRNLQNILPTPHWEYSRWRSAPRGYTIGMCFVYTSELIRGLFSGINEFSRDIPVERTPNGSLKTKTGKGLNMKSFGDQMNQFAKNNQWGNVSNSNKEERLQLIQDGHLLVIGHGGEHPNREHWFAGAGMKNQQGIVRPIITEGQFTPYQRPFVPPDDWYLGVDPDGSAKPDEYTTYAHLLSPPTK